MSANAQTARSEGDAWSRPLVRHLTAIVALKLMFLFLLWFLFFRLPDGSQAPGFDIHSHIAGPGGMAPTTEKSEDHQ